MTVITLTLLIQKSEKKLEKEKAKIEASLFEIAQQEIYLEETKQARMEFYKKHFKD